MLISYASFTFGQMDTIAPKLKKNKNYMNFVYKNLKYPIIALENGIQGRVDFSFQITSEGCIDSMKIVNTPHKLLSREVIKVLEKQNVNGYLVPLMELK